MPDNNKNGFTIIEVLIATAIMAIGLLALSSLQGTSAKGNLTARLISQAVSLGEQNMEELIDLPYENANCSDSDADGLSGLRDGLSGADHVRNQTIDNSVYTVYWNIAENSSQRTKKIHLVVLWNNNKNCPFDSIKPSI